MKITQVYELVNNMTKEVLGETEVLQEDLSNVVDIGGKLQEKLGVDNYCNELANRIGRTIFVNRPYSGELQTILKDYWEYGSILAKVRGEIPEAIENESWELVDGASYDPHVYKKPKVYEKFYNQATTFQIQVSITSLQVQESLKSPEDYVKFISMIEGNVQLSMEIKIEELAKRCVNNFIGETLFDAYKSGTTYTGVGNTRAINLFARYKASHPDTTLTVATALQDKEFIRYCVEVMTLTMNRMKAVSKLYNIEGTTKHTPKDYLHVVLLNDFESATQVYLQSDTYHNELVSLPKHETISYWQGSGTDFAFDSVSKINVITAKSNNVTASGILGVMFDDEALGVLQPRREVTTMNTPNAQFMNYWHKFTSRYFNDLAENFVVFFIA